MKESEYRKLTIEQIKELFPFVNPKKLDKYSYHVAERKNITTKITMWHDDRKSYMKIAEKCDPKHWHHEHIRQHKLISETPRKRIMRKKEITGIKSSGNLFEI